jgi:hypothetical protein
VKPLVIAPTEHIDPLIVVIRGQRVLLDSNLAQLYGVTTTRLNEQVKRNLDRFPTDFMFRLTQEEWEALISQIATSKGGRGGRRKLPYAFTEHGTVMAANVLNSPVAVRASIAVVRAFVRFRQMIASHEDLARKLDTLEKKFEKHDSQFRVVFDAIRQLMAPPPVKRRSIGFHAAREKER